MERVKRWKSATQSGVRFYCPGCGEPHVLPTQGREPIWGFNESLERPTLMPSILSRGPKPLTNEEIKTLMNGTMTEIKRPTVVCHSFVTDGFIRFLSDCTHEFANQTLELPQVEDFLDECHD